MDVRHETRNNLFLGQCEFENETIAVAAGQVGTWPKGLLLARNTVSDNFTAYDSGGSNGENEIRAVLPHAITFSEAGTFSARIIKGGPLNKNLISKLDEAAVTAAEFDQLVANTGVTVEAVRDSGGIESW